MEENTIVLQDIYQYVQTGINDKGKLEGRFEASGIRPNFIEKFEMYGIKLPSQLFRGNEIRMEDLR